MFEREISNLSSVNFTKNEEFKEFLKELTPATTWLNYKAGMLEVHAVHPGSSGFYGMGGWMFSSKEAVEELESKGGLYIKILLSDPIRIPLNLSTCPFTMDDRSGAKSKLLADLLGDAQYEKYADFVNTGFKHYSKQGLKLLIRGGKVLAIHTSKYVDCSQQKVFSFADDFMKTFHTSSFQTARYDVERTFARFAVCDSTDPFFEKYSDAWQKAGLPSQMLKKSFPMLEFVTGDTGKQTISIVPFLQIGSDRLPLGTELSIKHTSKATEEAIKAKANEAFANMQEGLTSVEEMIKTELINPYATFVRAGVETGICSKAKAAITAVLNNFKDYYTQGVDTITAFDVYYEMCQIEHYGEFNELSSGTKLQVLEGLNRLINLNWKKLDMAGREEF